MDLACGTYETRIHIIAMRIVNTQTITKEERVVI